MKKLLFAGLAALLFLGCSEDKTTEVEQNPYLPITGLEIPREAVAGENMTLKGKGFTEDCSLTLLLNGTLNAVEAPMVSVDEKSLVVALPQSLAMGFYAVRLTQQQVTTTIGGVNIRVDDYVDDDFEIYGLSGEEYRIFAASVSKQIKAPAPEPNSSTLLVGESGFATATPDGMVYYTGFEPLEGGALLFRIGTYDLTTGVNTPARDVENFVCMGVIDGKFCLLKTADRKTYSLVEWKAGVETPIRDFDLSGFGGGTLFSTDRRFVYHAATGTLVICGNMGSGSNMAQTTMSLDLATGAVNKNGGDSSNPKYWFASTGEELYAFVVSIDIREVSTTKVYLIDNPQQWSVKGEGATLLSTTEGAGFEGPVYSPATGKIYAIDDYETFSAVLTFDPQSGKIEGRRWVGAAMACLFYAPGKVAEEE